MHDIAYQNQDVTMKLLAEGLRGKSLEAFGLPHIQIRDLKPTNLPAIEANELRLDNLFLLEDGSLAVIDYESTYSKKDVVKYINYIARILKKYLKEYPGEMPRIHLIVLYAADIEKISTAVCDFGCMKLIIEAAFLRDLPTEGIFKRISEKIKRNEVLSDTELMQFIVLPLTVKGKDAKKNMVEKTVDLAKRLADDGQRSFTLAGILTFADKVMDQDFAKRIKEELRMNKVARLFFEDGFNEGIIQGMSKGVKVVINTYRNFGITQEDSIRKLGKEFDLSQEEAESYVRKYW
ncbi:MAG: hypothetical protein Q4F41_19785 [Eubacteriales bacterium]|nr:hypothetical protein [Eubacteriales bacterium]